MKTFKNCCFAVVLTFVLALSASAGNMHTLVADAPPPPPSTTDGNIHTLAADGEISTTVAGQMDTGVAGQIDTTSSVASPIDPLTQMTLTLFQSVLSLF